MDDKTTNRRIIKLGGKLYSLLYKTHDKLTDKKLLGTITTEEEKLLEGIRRDIESCDKHLIDFYQSKIDKYQELLEQINLINCKLPVDKYG